MKAALEFLKTHAISLACAGVALGAIIVAVLGMSGQATIVKLMNEKLGSSGANSIASLRGNPKNPEVIEQEKKRGQAFEADYKRTVDEAKRINERTPLMDKVFPKTDQAALTYAFKSAYQKEVEQLPGKLSAGTLPDDFEIAEEKSNVEELQQQEAEKDVETKTDRTKPGDVTPPPAIAPPTIASDFGGGSGRISGDGEFIGGGGRVGGGGGDFAGGGRTGGISMDVGPNTEPKYNWIYRARVAKARNIRCYVDRGTFQMHPLVSMTGQPKPEEMWLAQVSLWIQQDVVNAVASLNREAAKAVQDGEAYVEHSPVKRLSSVRVRGYVADRLLPFPSLGDAGMGESSMTTSFTEKKCNEQFDVIRFDVLAVVDQRESLRVIDAITKANFNKLLALEYTAVDRRIDQDQLGYFYGTAPVIQMRMEFETYMARDVFDALKPKEVAAMLGTAPPNP